MGVNKQIYELYQAQLQSAKPVLVIADKVAINTLTKAAGDCSEFSDTIVRVIYDNWQGELGFLYLIDSILKNIKGVYIKEFAKEIKIQLLKHFHKLDMEKVYRLLNTWQTFKLDEMPLGDILRTLFRQQMLMLNGNDKIIINNLTKSAQQIIDRGDVIVTVIYERINVVEDKLSHFYLIDSILKNVNDKYVTWFKDVDKVAVHLFHQNPNLREKIIKVVKTWEGMFDAVYMEKLQKELTVYNQKDTAKKLEVLILAKEKLKKSPALVQELLVLQKLLHVLTTKVVDQATLVQVEQKISELKIAPTVELKQESINTADEKQLFHLLYPTNDHQCKQCALRYDTKPKLQEHLDWHFRQNKVRKENKVVMSRDWYLPMDDWQTELPLDKDQGKMITNRKVLFQTFFRQSNSSY